MGEHRAGASERSQRRRSSPFATQKAPLRRPCRCSGSTQICHRRHPCATRSFAAASAGRRLGGQRHAFARGSNVDAHVPRALGDGLPGSTRLWRHRLVGPLHADRRQRLRAERPDVGGAPPRHRRRAAGSTRWGAGDAGALGVGADGGGPGAAAAPRRARRGGWWRGRGAAAATDDGVTEIHRGANQDGQYSLFLGNARKWRVRPRASSAAAGVAKARADGARAQIRRDDGRRRRRRNRNGQLGLGAPTAATRLGVRRARRRPSRQRERRRPTCAPRRGGGRRAMVGARRAAAAGLRPPRPAAAAPPASSTTTSGEGGSGERRRRRRRWRRRRRRRRATSRAAHRRSV